ncbi:MAG: hypothetical protein AABM42_12050 [Actinomycetota bacterium]
MKRRFDLHRTCPECGDPLTGRRVDATYCSTTCRVRAWKRRTAAVGAG